MTGTSLALDARRKTELCFVSHGHSDHIARHERVIATAATLRFMERRLGRLNEPLAVPYHAPLSVGELKVELFPAGHILGSAQIRVTRQDGLRVVYTGDLNLAPSLTAEPAQVAECDVLVLESTFGHPRYVFPPKQEVLQGIENWVREQLALGRSPILLAYPLGKGQEAVKHLGDSGFPVVVHPSVYEMVELYRDLGVSLRCRRFDGRLKEGEVGVFPAHSGRAAMAGVNRPARAVLTGWALDSGAARRFGADQAFPLSDHADFPSLVGYAKATRATEVVTHHGFADELARALRAGGVFARVAGQAVQLGLPL